MTPKEWNEFIVSRLRKEKRIFFSLATLYLLDHHVLYYFVSFLIFPSSLSLFPSNNSAQLLYGYLYYYISYFYYYSWQWYSIMM